MKYKYIRKYMNWSSVTYAWKYAVKMLIVIILIVFLLLKIIDSCERDS